MRLQADYTATEEKMLIIIHELSHRLLGGHGLDCNDKISILESHKRIYLFAYDVVMLALGDDPAALLVKREAGLSDPDYAQAWRWAMSMPYEQRQHQLQRLITQKKL
ncbi:MAG TPA: hypothetical protein VK978_03985 [Candidatus Saccharimonadales bacterium]|nr:hypothetical protein [Candidatus Saccharimonadales bacterium]